MELKKKSVRCDKTAKKSPVKIEDYFITPYTDVIFGEWDSSGPGLPNDLYVMRRWWTTRENKR